MGFSLQFDKAIPQCIWDDKETRIAKMILKKKEQEAEGNLILPDIILSNNR